MKVAKNQLIRMIREAVREQLDPNDSDDRGAVLANLRRRLDGGSKLHAIGDGTSDNIYGLVKANSSDEARTVAREAGLDDYAVDEVNSNVDRRLEKQAASYARRRQERKAAKYTKDAKLIQGFLDSDKNTIDLGNRPIMTVDLDL